METHGVVRGSQAVVVPETVCKISSEKEASAVVMMIAEEEEGVNESKEKREVDWELASEDSSA
jgi:hypothetical protein